MQYREMRHETTAPTAEPPSAGHVVIAPDRIKLPLDAANEAVVENGRTHIWISIELLSEELHEPTETIVKTIEEFFSSPNCIDQSKHVVQTDTGLKYSAVVSAFCKMRIKFPHLMDTTLEEPKKDPEEISFYALYRKLKAERYVIGKPALYDAVMSIVTLHTGQQFLQTEQRGNKQFTTVNTAIENELKLFLHEYYIPEDWYNLPDLIAAIQQQRPQFQNSPKRFWNNTKGMVEEDFHTCRQFNSKGTYVSPDVAHDIIRVYTRYEDIPENERYHSKMAIQKMLTVHKEWLNIRLRKLCDQDESNTIRRVFYTSTGNLEVNVLYSQRMVELLKEESEKKHSLPLPTYHHHTVEQIRIKTGRKREDILHALKRLLTTGNPAYSYEEFCIPGQGSHTLCYANRELVNAIMQYLKEHPTNIN